MTQKTMTDFEIKSKTIDTAKPLAGKIMQATKDQIGFVPNMYGIMANNPALLDAYTHAYNTFRENAGLTTIEQEVVLLSVAYENACAYCVAAHSFVADKMSGVPEEITNAIREGKELPDARLGALSEFTKIITKSRGNPSKSEVQAFLQAGYTKEHILGVITGVGVKTFSNYVNHLANTPLDDAFMRRKWSK